MNIKNNEDNFDSIAKLLKAICYDTVIHNKVINILKMESYPRQIILCNWLEQLRIQNAPQNLISALSCLFDDNLAEKVLEFVDKT